VKYAFVYIPSCLVLVSIGGFAMYHFSVSQPFDETISLLNHPTPDCVGYIPKAKALAENSIGQATISSYNLHFDGIQCHFEPDTNGTSKLQSILVSYQSPSGWAMTFTEDPLFTTVINSTIFPPTNFGP